MRKAAGGKRAQAQSLAAVAADSDRLFVEAFHNLYHPLLLRMREVVATGLLGKLQRVLTASSTPQCDARRTFVLSMRWAVAP